MQKHKKKALSWEKILPNASRRFIPPFILGSLFAFMILSFTNLSVVEIGIKNLDWNGDGIPDLFVVEPTATGSGMTEVHILAGYDGGTSTKNFQTVLLNNVTAWGYFDNSAQFSFVDWNNDGIPDLAVVEPSNTGSGKTEVHILKGEGGGGQNNFTKTRLLDVATSWSYFPSGTQFSFVDWDHDGISDLIAIMPTGTASGKTEVHILSGASNFQSSLLDIATAWGLFTNNAAQFSFVDWDNDGIPDLAVVEATNTGSKMTEVHILKGTGKSLSTNFQTILLDDVTLWSTFTNNPQFSFVDWNNDGIPDLAAIEYTATGSGMTEVHILKGEGKSGSNNFNTTRLLDSITPWGYFNNGSQFKLSLSPSVFNVTLYGAVSGATDSGSAFSQALTAAQSTCGVVLVPPGTFNIPTTVLTIPSCVTVQINGTVVIGAQGFGVLGGNHWSQIVLASGSTINGNGSTGTIEMAKNTNAQCMICATGNNTISNLIINGNRAYNSTPKSSTVTIASLGIYGDKVIVNQNQFKHSYMAVYGFGNYDTISSNTATDTGADFVHMGDFSGSHNGVIGPVNTSYLTVTNNTYDAGMSNGAFGISMDEVEAATVTGNSGTGGPNALNLIGLDNSSDSLISNNTVQDSAAEGLLAFVDLVGGTLNNNTISNNTIIRAGAVGTGLIDTAWQSNSAGWWTAIIQNNTIKNNTIIDADYRYQVLGAPPDIDVGIRLTGGPAFLNNTVTNNTCTSTMVGISPPRNGWNFCVGFDGHIPSKNNNFASGNTISAADVSKPFCLVRDLTTYGLNPPLYNYCL